MMRSFGTSAIVASLSVLSLGIPAEVRAASETPVEYATACSNLISAGNDYWYDSPEKMLYVSDDFVAPLRVTYPTSASFVTAVTNWFSSVASITGTSFSTSSGVVQGTFKDVQVVILTTTGSSCTLEPERTARHIQPFLNGSGQVTIAGTTITIPLQYSGDDSGSGIMAYSIDAQSAALEFSLEEEDSIVEEAAAEQAAGEVRPGGGITPLLAVYSCGRGGGGGDAVNWCQACATDSSHRRGTRIEAYYTPEVLWLWEERGSEVEYHRRTSANCSTSGSWEDWYTYDHNDAWNYSCFTGEVGTADDYDRGSDHQNDVWEGCINCFDFWEEGAIAHGASKSKVSNVWFTTHTGVACTGAFSGDCDDATPCDIY